MKLLLAAMGVLVSTEVYAQGFDQGSPDGFSRQAPSQNDSPVPVPGVTYLGPIRSNAYGPGIHADATGRPFQWQAEGQPSTSPDPTLQVKPNAYGLGVHADQYGRIVRPEGLSP